MKLRTYFAHAGTSRAGLVSNSRLEPAAPSGVCIRAHARACVRASERTGRVRMHRLSYMLAKRTRVATWLQFRRQHSFANSLWSRSPRLLPLWLVFLALLGARSSANPVTRSSHQRARRPGILVWRVVPAVLPKSSRRAPWNSRWTALASLLSSARNSVRLKSPKLRVSGHTSGSDPLSASLSSSFKFLLLSDRVGH